MSRNPKEKPTKGRRKFLTGAVAGLAGGALAAASSTSADEKQQGTFKSTGLHPDGAPAADTGYSPGVLAEGRRVVFVSGQGPEDVKADMETQMRQTFDRIGKVLAAGGRRSRTWSWCGRTS